MDEPTSRRDFLNRALGAWAATAAVGGAAAAGAALWPREEPPSTTRIPKSAVAGGRAAGSLRGTPFVLVVSGSGAVALSLVCTHARCIVRWEDAEKRFLCPCHKGTFDPEGRRLSGPPPADLRRFTVIDAGDSWEVTG
ncbi:MAG: Rieske (2Fe-2S) protein [Planctomycetota bacterium]